MNAASVVVEPESGRLSVLIAGCGYLGYRVAAGWVSQGVPVSAITRSAAKSRELSAQGIQPLLLDLSAGVTIPELPAAQVVLWAVGFDRLSGVRREQIWIDGLDRLIQGLSSAPSPRRFIYVSSTSVYGDAGGDEVHEDVPPAPTTEGGVACWQAEQHLQLCLQRYHPNTEAIVLRMAGIYGPDRLLRRVADLRGQVPITFAPDDWLNLIHVDDAAAMIRHVAVAEHVPPVINVVNSGTLTRRQYYSELSTLVDAPPPIFGDVSATESSSRQRSGNKRVVSRRRDSMSVTFLYDDVRRGLQQAVSGR